MRARIPTPTDVLLALYERRAATLHAEHHRVSDHDWTRLRLTLESRGWLDAGSDLAHARMTDAGRRHAARIQARRHRAFLEEERATALRDPVALDVIRRRYARDGRILRLVMELEAHRSHVCQPRAVVSTPHPSTLRPAAHHNEGTAVSRFHSAARYRIGPCARCGCSAQNHNGAGGSCRAYRRAPQIGDPDVLCGCAQYMGDVEEERHRELLAFVRGVAGLIDEYDVEIDMAALTRLVQEPHLLTQTGSAPREQVPSIDAYVVEATSRNVDTPH